MITPVKRVGRYELLDPIGHGGMAVVYLARQIDLDRRVALKELRVFQAPDDPALAERFLREAHVAGSLSHPNVVTVHEYFKHEGTPYIAMEYLQRGSLRPWVGHMTVAQIAGVLEGLLAALDHAETYRIVHRDLKPENLLVTDQGQIKVADFGIAKARMANTNPFLTAAGTTVGTPTYMAPEQAMAQELGPYTDLYSVGIMAYELFVGQVPFHDTDTPVGIILRHVNEKIPLAHTVNPAVNLALSEWIDRLLVKDPAQRTQTAAQAWDEFEEVILPLCGSRWRREARLTEPSEQPTAKPLTPAPFTSTDVDTPVPEPSSEFESFAWGAPASAPTAGQAAAAPAPTPIPEPAPPPAPAEPEPAPPPSAPGFVTFAKPSPVSEPPAPMTPPSVRPVAPAPAASSPAAAAAAPAPAPEAPVKPPAPSPARPAVPLAPASEPAFKTFAGRDARPLQADTPAPPVDPPPAPPGPPAWVPPVKFPAPPPPQPDPAPMPLSALSDVDAATVSPDAVPVRQVPPAPTTSPEVRRRRLVALGGGAAVVAAAVGGVVLAAGGGSGDAANKPSPTPPGTFTLENADLALTVPTSWPKIAAPKIPGLDKVKAVAGGPRGGLFVAAELVGGRADPSLLPSKLLRALTGGRPKHETTTLGDLQAYRYSSLQPRGVDGPLRVYTVLTSGGVATVMCTPPPAGGARAADCDKIAKTLRLKSADGLPIGPSKDYGALLNKTFDALAAQIKTVNIRAERAPVTVAAQATTLRQYERVFQKAQASLAVGHLNAVDSGLNARLKAVFRELEIAYAQLERAARDHDAKAYARAERALRRGRAKLKAALPTLHGAGYTQLDIGTPRVVKPAKKRTSPPAAAQQPVAPPPVAPPQVAPQPATPPPPPAAPPVIVNGGGGD